jgi:hypothetical protein
MSLLNYYMRKAKELSEEVEGIETPQSLDVLHDLVLKQHLGVPIGKKGFLELSGPKGPNLSPRPTSGGRDYMGRPDDKPPIPGYSMKYTLDF